MGHNKNINKNGKNKKVNKNNVQFKEGYNLRMKL